MWEFQVLPSGMLRVADYEGPQTRAELYDVDLSDMSCGDDILSALDDCESLAQPLFGAFDQARYELQEELEGLAGRAAGVRRKALEKKLSAMEGDDDDVWRAWIESLSEAEVGSLLAELQRWLEKAPDPDSDQLDRPLDGIAFAFEILEQESGEVLDLFEIELIDGPMPGSNFQAARLGITAEEASSLAATHGLPYVFVAVTEDE